MLREVLPEIMDVETFEIITFFRASYFLIPFLEIHCYCDSFIIWV